MTRLNLVVLYLALVIGVGESWADNSIYIEPASAELKSGRKLWIDNCENCHGHGTADAPIPMQPDEWRKRVTKNSAVLYSNAIDGYIGPDYSMMPARGGNEDLTDGEVRAAVDYMVYLARYYIDQNKTFIKP